MSAPISDAQRVGRHVRAALAEHGETQQDIGRVLGLTHAAITRRVQGHVSFRADELIKIAEFLGVDPERFFRPLPQPRSSRSDTRAGLGAA